MSCAAQAQHSSTLPREDFKSGYPPVYRGYGFTPGFSYNSATGWYRQSYPAGGFNYRFGYSSYYNNGYWTPGIVPNVWFGWHYNRFTGQMYRGWGN